MPYAARTFLYPDRSGQRWSDAQDIKERFPARRQDLMVEQVHRRCPIAVSLRICVVEPQVVIVL